LVLYADPLTAWFLDLASRFFPEETARRLAGPVSEYVLFTFAAQLTTLPVMLFHFHSFSLNTFLANPAILPVQPPIMVLGGLATILGTIWLPLGRLTAPFVYPFVLYTIRMVEWFSQLPIEPIHFGELKVIWIFVFYGFLGLLTFGFPLLQRFAETLSPVAAVSGLTVLAVLAWRLVFSSPDGDLHLHLLDVGTGSAIYLESPSGQRVLINGGPSPKNLSDHLGRLQPPFRRRLDLVIVAAPQEQDLDALAGTIPRFRPEKMVWLGDPGLCWEAEYLRTRVDELGIPFVLGKAGEEIVFQDGLRLQILAVDQRGGTLLVEQGRFRAVLPFGITGKSRASLLAEGYLKDVTVLLLADNGYQSSNPSDWIDTLHPQVLLLSAGIQDGRGLPDRGLLDRLGGYSLLRTDQYGSIHLSTDGIKLWIAVERLP
jgi:competence protein ComEC